jgi:benzaldehyde dehydrogenase (NAD)
MGHMSFNRTNPISGEIASTSAAMSADDARATADRAAGAFLAWSQTGPNTRRQLLNAAADALEARKDDFVRATTAEIGATAGWAMFNLSLAAGMMREAAELTTHITGDVIPSDKPGCISLALREPAGVVLGIAPWNAPIILGVRAIAVPLACGNSVILKASEMCPRTHSLIVESCVAAGFPQDVVSIVTNQPADAAQVVGELIDHPAVRRINFTGSTTVGKIVAKRAAENLKPCLLELGGKARDASAAKADLGLWIGEAYNHVQSGVTLDRAKIAFNFWCQLWCQRRGSEGNSGDQRVNMINKLLIHKDC